MATLVTKQKIAEISLNEVDVVKVLAGQKAVLTFDAIPNLTITGEVAEIDGIGAASQGVVTYTAKISFISDTLGIKPGMSVSVEIVTLEKLSVLLLPSSAVKERGLISYVEVVDEKIAGQISSANIGAVLLKNPPRQQTVEMGDSNDEFIELLSG